jgi:signal transduction histidine kinase
MPHIFEPFYTTREGGAGLGLWVVREKLADLGGSVLIESKKGTTVTIVIPVEPGGSPQAGTPQKHETGDSQ